MRPGPDLCILLTFSPIRLYTAYSVSARIMTCQCPRSSAISVVIWFLAISSLTRSRHLSFGLPRFRFPSTDICKIFLVASLFILHLNMSKPSQPLPSEEFRHRVHVYVSDMIYSHLSFYPPQHAHFNCVQFSLLLLPNCPTLCTIHHGRYYS